MSKDKQHKIDKIKIILKDVEDQIGYVKLLIESMEIEDEHKNGTGEPGRR